MGRKSLAAERRAQILDALEACVRESGLESTSLEIVAQRAGVRRTLIGHYFGTRQDLVDALVDRLLERWQDQYEKARAKSGDPFEFDIDYLFGESQADGTESAVLEALLYAARYDEQLRGRLLKAIRSWESAYRELIRERHPEASADRVRRLAYSMLCLSFGSWTLLGVGYSASDHAQARKSADDLLVTLERDG